MVTVGYVEGVGLCSTIFLMWIQIFLH